MSDWTPSERCPGYREKTVKRGPATIIILRPVLDQVEQARREQKTRAELENAMRDYLYRRRDA